MEDTDDEKDDKKSTDNTANNDVISSYFKDIKKIMDLHGRMVSAVDDTVNRLPFDKSINYTLAATIVANSQKLGKKHKDRQKNSNKNTAKKLEQQNNQKNHENNKKDDEITTLINKKDEIMNAMNKQIASLQNNNDENAKQNILTAFYDKLSLIDDMNEEILKLKNIQNHENKQINTNDDEFNDENEVTFDDMDIAEEHAKLKKVKSEETDLSQKEDEKEEEEDKPFTFHFVGIGKNNINNRESIKIMDKVKGVTVETKLKGENTMNDLKNLIYDEFNVPINNREDKNDILMIYSHLILNDEFSDNKTLIDIGIMDNSFILIAIKDKEEKEIDGIFNITSDQMDVINERYNTKEKEEEEEEQKIDIGQILQRLKIEKKLSLDIITQETDVEVFKMPNCGHSMTASSLYDYALSQCLNKQKMLTCAHFKCSAEWQYPIIKKYLLTNIEDDIIASIILEKEREEKQKQDILRQEWNINSLSLIYSRSKNKWFNAKIVDITGQDNNEWLLVKYGNNYKKKKKIQRNCKDIKPIPIHHPSKFVKGSKCEIFSDVININNNNGDDDDDDDDDNGSNTNWFKGDIIDIFNDDEGEWLTVKYLENGKNKICDIQRYSNDIKLIIKESEEIKSEKQKNKKKYDVHYISKIKCGKLEILLSRNILFRNKKYSVQKCIECNTLLYRIKTDKLNKIKFETKCRMCSTQFCWSCNKKWKSNHSCDASFRFQILDILSKCELKQVGQQQNVPSVRCCPLCSSLIYHVEACKHMDCTECHQSFCFVCLKTKNDNDQWQCGGYSEYCPDGVYPRQTNKDLPPMTYTKKFQLF